MKMAIVTGGSRGIGAAIVRRFFDDGWRVSFTYRERDDAASRVIDSCPGGGVRGYRGTMATEKDVRAFLRSVKEQAETIDALVINAGIVRDGLLGTLPASDWQDVLNTNLVDTFFLLQSVIRRMVAQRKGCITFVSSVSAHMAPAGQAAYAASKGAINSLSKCLSHELAPRGIRVNSVSPGIIDTAMVHNLGFENEETRARLLQRVSLGRIGHPEEVANVIHFLSSEAASYVTGTNVLVDGGLT